MNRILFCLAFCLSATLAAAQPAGGQPIRIAGSLDLSGPAASLGQESLFGAQVAVDEINKKGGLLGRQVTLTHQDNGTNVQRAVNQGAQMARDGAVMLLAPVSSGSTIAATRAVSEKFKVPMCVPISGSDQITMKEFQPYIFTHVPNLYMIMRAVAHRLATRPHKRYAIMVPDYAGGRDAVRWFKSFMLEMNPKVEFVVEEYPKLGATDYTATINKLLAAKPDYVWGHLFGSDLLTFSKQATAVGFFKQINNNFITVGDTDTLKQLGENAPFGIEGFQYAPFAYLLSSKSNSSQEAKDWIKAYKAKTGVWPSDWAVMSYDCIMSWAQAVTSAKTTDADPVMRAIETNEFTSVRGRYRYAKYDHQALIPVYLGRIVQSKEFGQPLLEIDQDVPADVTHATEAIVEKYRKAPN